MRFGSWESERFEISSGLPQGSPLSCVLFNIYTADVIDWTQDDNTDPYSYVDDIIISCASHSPVEDVANLQQASEKLQVWTENNHMKIQPDKICWMLLSLGHVNRDLFTLTYEGQPVRQEMQVTYLGEVIDARLSMIKQIDNNIRKAKSALGLIRNAARQNIKLSSLVQLVRATAVLSILQYGLHLCSLISDTQFVNMDRVLCQVLRIISGATSKTSGEAIL